MPPNQGNQRSEGPIVAASIGGNEQETHSVEQTLRFIVAVEVQVLIGLIQGSEINIEVEMGSGPKLATPGVNLNGRP